MKKTFLQILEQSQDELHGQALRQTGFWGRAGAGAIFMARDTGRIFLPLRSEYVEQPNTWGTWGGAIDEGENPAEAAAREAYEEAGYSPRPEDIIPLYVFKHPSGFQYFNFLILVPHEFEHSPHPESEWETADADWFEHGNWPSPMHFGLKNLLRDPKSSKTIYELSKRFSESGRSTQQTQQPQDDQGSPEPAPQVTGRP